VSEHRFTATLVADEGTGGHWLEVPFDVQAAFGQARPPVRGTVNGTPLRTRLLVYGGTSYLGLTKAVLAQAGIAPGDPVEAVLELDDAPREVAVPSELEAVLAGDAAARSAFDALAFTHRKEYAVWVGEAKKAETRERRAARALDMLRAGVRHP
jgi:hypothetical protein